MTAVSKSFGGAVALESLRQNLMQVRNRVPDAGGSPYLRMLTDGDWVFGQENNAVAEGSEVVFNVMSIKQGFTCWTNRPGNAKNECKGEEMASLGEPPIVKGELPTYRDEASGPDPLAWKEQFSVEVKFIGGRYDGTQVLWKNSSVGGTKAFAAMLDAILERIGQGSPYVFPIAELRSDYYQHKAHGRTWFPVVEIVGWMDGNGEEEGGEPRTPIEQEPKAETKKAAISETPESRAPVEEPKAAEGAVRRRRRTA